MEYFEIGFMIAIGWGLGKFVVDIIKGLIRGFIETMLEYIENRHGTEIEKICKNKTKNKEVRRIGFI